MKSKLSEKVAGLETALALTFGLLLVNYFSDIDLLPNIAILVSLFALLWNRPFQVISRYWMGLGHVMGAVVSTVILSVLYYGMVCPMGALFKLFQKNPLRIKKESETLFVDREHRFQPADMEKVF